MSNSWFQFKQFKIEQDKTAMKVTTDACLFGAWVAKKINELPFSPTNILDIGAGTGLLSLMLAQVSEARIDAVEIDAAAAQQAEENFAASPWSSRLVVMNGDVRDLNPEKMYDLVVSNPPFYENDLRSPDELRSKAHHNGGLLMTELLIAIKKLCGIGGHFFLLLPYKRLDEVRGLINENGCSIAQLCLVKQSPNHAFFRALLMGKNDISTNELISTEIIIKNDNAQYTSQFKNLVGPYYLDK